MICWCFEQAFCNLGISLNFCSFLHVLNSFYVEVSRSDSIIKCEQITIRYFKVAIVNNYSKLLVVEKSADIFEHLQLVTHSQILWFSSVYMDQLRSEFFFVEIIDWFLFLHLRILVFFIFMNRL